MTARECVAAARQAGDAFQRPINAFVDEFRRADPSGREALVRRTRRRPGGFSASAA